MTYKVFKFKVPISNTILYYKIIYTGYGTQQRVDEVLTTNPYYYVWYSK